MLRQLTTKKRSRFIALALAGAISQPVLVQVFLRQSVAQAPAPAPADASCAAITTPLTPEEENYARTAWQYFLSNYQPNTGLVNAFDNYPSGTLWDMGNYLMALNAARWLNLTDQGDFDARLNRFLQTLGGLRLFEDSLPNKVYNTATGEMVDYSNTPIERGIGWSALDIGRLLAALHVIRTCHPQYSDWLNSILESWAIERSIQDGQLFGALVLPDNQTQLVQEGRLGYEEYAARGYELWGYSLPAAISFEPFKLVEIYGVQVPVDTRNYQSTNANNYVVSESYILDGIEFGYQGRIAEYAARVLEVQQKRYQATGQLTAVTEDNIDGPPHFLYNTVYANGVAWATITDTNEAYPDLRTISTKAAFGWRYISPESSYAQQLFGVVQRLISPDGRGFYAGLYEKTNEPNTALTGNTNGLILEILHYKARGNRPLIGHEQVTVSTGESEKVELVQGYPPPENLPTVPRPAAAESSSPLAPPQPASQLGNQPAAIAVEPIPPVAERLQRPDRPIRALSMPESRFAEAAWSYFEANYQSETGLVSDRSDMKGATLWGLGDYLAALQAARALKIITPEEFDQRTRLLLGALARLPLFAGELPHRGYDIRTLQPVDYGLNPVPEGRGWSGLDVGRMLLALYQLKSSHPEYTEAIDQIALGWSYLRVVDDSRLHSAIVEQDRFGRSLTRVRPVTRLGYEEYAARGFQLWGFDVNQAAVGNQYKTISVEGWEIPVQRQGRSPDPETPTYTVSDPFLRYGLELGFDPQMRSLVNPLLQAQVERYQRQGQLTAATTTLLTSEPFVIHSTVVGSQRPWATLDNDGQPVPNLRVVSTAAAFALHALFPDEEYTQKLRQSVTDLYNPLLGYYEGSYETTGKPTMGFSSGTNSLILQSLLYESQSRKPLLAEAVSLDSPWWQAIAAGDSGSGLPTRPTTKAHLVSDTAGTYWASDEISPDALVNRAAVKPTEVQGVTNPGQSDRALESTPTASPTLAPTEINAEPLPSKPAVRAAADQDRQVAQPPGGRKEPETTTQTPEPSLQPSDSTPNPSPEPTISLTEADKVAAQRAWQYFKRNWNQQTGLVNGVENLPWTTLWDQGSALLGIHAAYQLDVIQPAEFSTMMERFLKTLDTLPLAPTGLPNKAYNTRTGAMQTLDNRPDPSGKSGWSVLDTARFLLALHVLRVQYPEYANRIDRAVQRWNLSKLVNNGWLQGGISTANGTIQLVQEGRLGYEQYAAQGLKVWGLQAQNALNNPPVKTVQVDGVALQVDQRNLQNSGASNYLTNDPYLLWGLEMGWTDAVKPQVENLFKLQAQRYEKTGILTAVNEDSLDRPPYFLYYSVYVNDEPWQAITVRGQNYPELKFLSTKAAFAWGSLMPKHAYAKTLRDAVQNLADVNRGYLGGRYENPQLGGNTSIDVNINGIILESLLYKARGYRPLLEN